MEKEIDKKEMVGEAGDTVQTPPTKKETVTDEVQVVEEVNHDEKQEAKGEQVAADNGLLEMENELKQRDEQIKALQDKLAEAVNVGKAAANLEKSVTDLTADLETKKSVIGEYEGILTNIVESKIKKVPTQFHDLIPTNMSLTEKLAWLDKAESTGLFGEKEKPNPQMEIGKPMNIENPKVDVERLSASEMMKMAFSTIKR